MLVVYFVCSDYVKSKMPWHNYRDSKHPGVHEADYTQGRLYRRYDDAIMDGLNRTCEFHGCSEPHYARGYCKAHFNLAPSSVNPWSTIIPACLILGLALFIGGVLGASLAHVLRTSLSIMFGVSLSTWIDGLLILIGGGLATTLMWKVMTEYRPSS